MNVLFLHDAFPAQFGRLGLELSRRYGWDCRYLVKGLSRCPEPSPAMLAELEVRTYEVPGAPVDGSSTPWPQVYGGYVEQCRAVLDSYRGLPGPEPDLIVANGGRGAPTILLGEAYGGPIVTYCEYYFARSHRDLSYRLDLPPAEPAPFFPRIINAPTLASLVGSTAGYSPTRWQRDSFPPRFHPKIAVHFDGVDTALYSPGPRPRSIAGRSIGGGTKVVTYVARGLESVRGYDLFLAVAERIARARPDVLFVVAGDDRSYYGWDYFHAGGAPFREWAGARTGLDPSRVVHLGQVTPEALAEVFRASDLHLYLSVPFVASWSLFHAMSAGRVVLAGEVDPVLEVLSPGVTGLVGPLFDAEGLAERAIAVLDDPAGFAPLGEAARDRMGADYSIEACVPPLRSFFERSANGGGS